MSDDPSFSPPGPFSVTRLSATVSRIVENDPYQESPFIYVIESTSSLVIIDTGCGTGNLLDFIKSQFDQKPADSKGTEEVVDDERGGRGTEIQGLGRKLVVVNTHNHYDHVAGNYLFSPSLQKPIGGEQLGDGVEDKGMIGLDHPEDGLTGFRFGDLCMGDRSRSYSEAWFNSLGPLVGCHVRPYHVTRWLADGDVILLSDDVDKRMNNVDKNDFHSTKEDKGEADKTGGGMADGMMADNYLQVIHTPGHTPDSICLWYPLESRLFVGDFIYRYADIMAIGPGSSAIEFEESCGKLINLIGQFKQEADRKQQKVTLCCGHIDDALDPASVVELRGILQLVNGGHGGEGTVRKITKGGMWWCHGYETENKDLKFALRKWMRLDFVTVPLVTLFLRLIR